MSLIQFDQLTRSYGRRRGIEELSLSVEEGALFGFLGPNGAGKTTVIRVMLGFLRPSSGCAWLFGKDSWHDTKAIKQDVGYLPGDLRLPPWFSGNSALSIFSQVRGKDLIRPGRELAEKFALDLTVCVRAMSRGMRQKLGLILALAHSPRLLVLDEPTSSLDPLIQQVLLAHLRKISAAGHTVFFSSHSLSEVEQLCSRVAIVREGKLVADEALSALRARAGHEVTIVWADASTAANFEAPFFLKLLRQEPGLWQGVLEGPVSGLLEFLTGKPVQDLVIGRPDLESLFRRFYQTTPEARE